MLDPILKIELYPDSSRVLCLCFDCSPCMAINVSVEYDAGFLPDMIITVDPTYLLYYYLLLYRGTRLNAIKRFCLCSL